MVEREVLDDDDDEWVRWGESGWIDERAVVDDESARWEKHVDDNDVVDDQADNSTSWKAWSDGWEDFGNDGDEYMGDDGDSSTSTDEWNAAWEDFGNESDNSTSTDEWSDWDDSDSEAESVS